MTEEVRKKPGPPPRLLTDGEKELAIDLALEGRTEDHIATALNMTRKDLWRMKQRDPSFGRELKRARADGCEALLDRHQEDLAAAARLPALLTNHQVLKLQGDHIRWRASRLLREDYGDRLDVTVTLPDVGPLLERAQQRRLVTEVTAQLVPRSDSVSGVPDPEDDDQERNE